MRALHAILDAITSPSILLFSGQGRAFCAGGDIREMNRLIHNAPTSHAVRTQAMEDILHAEYSFLRRLHALRGSGVVSVAVADGVAFGFGMGLHQACEVRVVTRDAKFSMPEVRIGIVPDCGASWFLTRLPGAVGMYAALTGCRIGSADALALGLADGGAEKGWRGEGIGTASVEGVMELLGCDVGVCSELAKPGSDVRVLVDQWFAKASVKEIWEAIREGGGSFAEEVENDLRKGAPIAMEMCFECMKEGYVGGGLNEAIDRELKAELILGIAPDFQEGVRALLIDKDMKPLWQPLPTPSI